MCLAKTARAALLRSTLLDEGAAHLQLIIDFDRTLTTAASVSTYGVIDMCLSEASRAANSALFRRYYPIEHSQSLTSAEKAPHMEDWWEGAHDVFIADGGLTQTAVENSIDSALQTGKVALRKDAESLLLLCVRAGLPVVVFTAGMANVLQGVLQRKLGAENAGKLHVVGNFMRFHTSGALEGFSSPTIHTFCKNEGFCLRSSAAYDDLLGRRNVICVGDSLGDAGMADGLPHSSVLKIGFLNRNDDDQLESGSSQRLAAYASSFDEVWDDNEFSLTMVHALLQSVVAGQLKDSS